MSEPEIRSGTMPDSETVSGTEIRPDAVPNLSQKLGLRPCLQKLHPESELTVYEAETRPETEPESKTRSGPMPESEIRPETVSESETRPDTELESETRSKTEPESETRPETMPETVHTKITP